LVKNIVKERNIRKRIEELMAYKKLGLTTFTEIEVRVFDKNLPIGLHHSKERKGRKVQRLTIKT
jgi:hypothetical protein